MNSKNTTLSVRIQSLKPNNIMQVLACMGLGVACIDDSDRGNIETAEIYAIGDSIFDWYVGSGDSAPEKLGKNLNREVYNAAISGAMMTDDSEYAIPNQYQEGNWDWIVMDGGANDLNDLCACGECNDVQDNIEAALTDFVAAREAKISVIIWGYYGIPENAEFGFDRCGEELAELSVRQQAIAETDNGIHWVDGREVIDGQDSAAFDTDMVHPSVMGAELIAKQIADVIVANE